MSERAASALRSQSAQLGLKARLDVVKVPAKPLDGSGPLADEILAVVEQEPDLARLVVEVGDRQVGFAKRRPGDRQGIDRIGLAELALRAARTGHQLRRDAIPRSAGDQLALEATADVATVLEPEPALLAQGAGPFKQPLVAALVACDRELVAKLAGGRVTAAAECFACGVDADRDHRLRSSMLGVSRTDLRRTRPTEARARSYQVKPAILDDGERQTRFGQASGRQAGLGHLAVVREPTHWSTPPAQ